MIRAIRPQAMAQDDASMVADWNIAPNVEYFLRLFPGSASCGVFLYASDATRLIASGAALTGTGQPCILIPQAGQTLAVMDAELGWHMLLTTDGTESPRTIRIGPAVDLPDEIHPIYADDDLAVVRARAGIDDHAHYIDVVSVSCPLGFGAWIGDVASVPVDGSALDGQTESITWTGTPSGTIDTVVIRMHVAIAPEPFAEATPPTVADDTGTATHLVGTSGNVLTNDSCGLAVVAVNGLAANVGSPVSGDNGGMFTIGSSGAWAFDPTGDFALLSGSETADTSITYHVSDGTAEASATLTVTVIHANAAPVASNDTGETDAATPTSGNVLANDTDAEGGTLTVSKVAGLSANVGVPAAGSSGGLFTIGSSGAWAFDPNSEFATLTGEQTATTTVKYHVSDGVAEDEGTLTVTVTAAIPAGDPYFASVVMLVQPPADATDGSTSLVDMSSYAHSVTIYGNAQIDTGIGEPAILFDGTGDYITIAAGPEVSFGPSVDFTAELFFRYPGSSKAYPVLLNAGFSAWQVGSFNLVFDGNAGINKLVFSFFGDNLVAASTMAYNVFNHAVIQRSGDTLSLLGNGALLASATGKGGNTYNFAGNSNKVYVGVAPHDLSQTFTGHVGSVRITRGVVRYVAGYTVPSMLFPAL
jgi:VCBS repeat-containing protein